MSFQDNSGDIILDAVLTNLGRKLLSRGDGSFRVAKFALGDDEVNYGLYNSDANPASKDLKLLQVPVFEASTNEATALRYRALSLSSNDHLYLPVARVNTKAQGGGIFDGFPFAEPSVNASTQNQYVVLVNQDAVDQYTGDSVTDKAFPVGFINGVNAKNASKYVIRVEQGFDSEVDDVTEQINPELVEDQFTVQMDDRLLKLASPDGVPYVESFVDTDNIASYIVPRITLSALTQGGAAGAGFYVDAQKTQEDANLGSIEGSTSLQFRFSLYASNAVQGNSKLYTTIGVTRSGYFTKTSADAQTIDTVVKLIGNKTGLTLDIPVRVARKAS